VLSLRRRVAVCPSRGAGAGRPKGVFVLPPQSGSMPLPRGRRPRFSSAARDLGRPQVGSGRLFGGRLLGDRLLGFVLAEQLAHHQLHAVERRGAHGDGGEGVSRRGCLCWRGALGADFLEVTARPFCSSRRRFSSAPRSASRGRRHRRSRARRTRVTSDDSDEGRIHVSTPISTGSSTWGLMIE
jgi:hypothetical protein